MASLVFWEGKATGTLSRVPLWGTRLHLPCVPFLPPLVPSDKPQGIIRFTLNEPSYPPVSMSLPLDSEVLGWVINGFPFYRGPKRQDNKNKQAHCRQRTAIHGDTSCLAEGLPTLAAQTEVAGGGGRGGGVSAFGSLYLNWLMRCP